MKILPHTIIFATLVVLRILVKRLESLDQYYAKPSGTLEISTTTAISETSEIAKPPIATAISRLPKSAGTASQLFDELWNRTGNQAGEVTATVREMVDWNENFTDSKIRHWLRTLESLGYIIVEGTGKRGVKRILVNQPTRLVHETPLFNREIAGNRNRNHGNLGNRETIATPEITGLDANREITNRKSQNPEISEIAGNREPRPATPQIAPHPHTHTHAREDILNNNININNKNINISSNNQNQSNQINQSSQSQSANFRNNYAKDFSAASVFGAVAAEVATMPQAKAGDGLPNTPEKAKLRQQILREIARYVPEAGAQLRERVATAIADFGIEKRLFDRWLAPIKNNESKNSAGYLCHCLKKELAERNITLDEIELQRKKCFKKQG
jgi:hypothetical protein